MNKNYSIDSDSTVSSLITSAKNLHDWFKHTLSEQEGRSNEEIGLLYDIAEKWSSSHASENSFDVLWHYYLFCAWEWSADALNMEYEIGNELSPSLDNPEFALALGMFLSEKALHLLSEDSLAQSLYASQLIADARASRFFWLFVRGYTRCRKPFQVDINEGVPFEYNFQWWYAIKKIENVRYAARSKYNHPGGYDERKQKLRDIWLKGQYKFKKDCVANEHKKLFLSKDAALKALRGLPKAKST